MGFFKARENNKFFSERLGESQGESVDLDLIYCLLCEGYGWELHHVKELSEIELLQSLSNLRFIKKQKRAEIVSLNSLSVAAGFGSKEANKEIKKINDDAKRSAKSRDKTPISAPVALNELSDEELLSLCAQPKK